VERRNAVEYIEEFLNHLLSQIIRFWNIPFRNVHLDSLLVKIMPKSIYSKRYLRFLELLKQARLDSNTTQTQLAGLIGVTQSVISKMESGERRLDVVEVIDICSALGLSKREFFEAAIKAIDRQ
jgi:DNA-binding XRE family transcriptional regulator